LVPPESATAPGPRLAAELPADEASRADSLERLSGDLEDQRLQLAEQYERLLRERQDWRREQAAAAAELEAAGQRLQEREQALDRRASALEPAESRLAQRLEEAAHTRQHLEGWQARLTAREVAWAAEREELLFRLRTRQELSERQRAALLGLCRRWVERRGQEEERLREARAETEAVRREYAAARQHWLRRAEALERMQRSLAGRRLALEQYQLECVGQATDSAAAEKRLRRLRRRWQRLSAAAERRLAKERRELEAEAARLEEQARRCDQETAAQQARAAEASRRRTEGECEDFVAESAQAALRQELLVARARCALYERQLAELRDEVERVARLLIDGRAGSDSPDLLAA
jgi:hypothetical protein